MRINVVLPAGGPAPSFPGAPVLAYATATELRVALAVDCDAAVLIRPDEPLDEGAVADAIRAAAAPVIEVQRERWDGSSHSAVSAACRGVISGFGEGGVAAAVLLFERESARG